MITQVKISVKEKHLLDDVLRDIDAFEERLRQLIPTRIFLK